MPLTLLIWIYIACVAMMAICGFYAIVWLIRMWLRKPTLQDREDEYMEKIYYDGNRPRL
jgi:hypothetical protein